MDFSLFCGVLLCASILVVVSFICLVRQNNPAWIFLILISLVVLVPGIAGMINPRVEAINRVERGYFSLVELETNLPTNPYVIEYDNATEFRYYKDGTATLYRTVKGQYTELEFMTAAEISANYAPTVRVMEETDTLIYPYFIWKIKAPDVFTKTGVIRFYLKVPQDRVIIQ